MSYMDDTVYIDKFKAELQSMIDLSKEFFSLHDIHINGSKCELLTINSPTPKSEQYVYIGQENKKISAIENEIRYLGI